jgi:hypothetical protein
MVDGIDAVIDFEGWHIHDRHSDQLAAENLRIQCLQQAPNCHDAGVFASMHGCFDDQRRSIVQTIQDNDRDADGSAIGSPGNVNGPLAFGSW